MLFWFRSIAEEIVFFWNCTVVPEDWSKSLLQYQQGIDIIFYRVIIWAAKKGVAYRYLLYWEHSIVGEIAKILIFTKASFIISIFTIAVKCNFIFRLGKKLPMWWEKVSDGRREKQEHWVLDYFFCLNFRPWIAI